MDFLVESCGALPAAVARAARAAEPERAAAWARWTLDVPDDPPEGGSARALAWRLLTRGALVPTGPDLETELRARFGARAGEAASALHRVQCAALAAGGGEPPRIDGDLARTGEFASEEAAWLYEAARRDLAALLGDLRRLRPEERAEDGLPLFVSWTGAVKHGWNLAWTGDGGPAGAALELRAQTPAFARDDAALAALARRFLGVRGLRPGQADAVAALLAGRDLSLALPTGGGKSLVFQLAALLSPGTALIVAPLRALLRDQRRRLAEAGVTRVGLLAGDEPEATRRALAELARGRLLLALAAPERLDSASFRDALRGAAETVGIPFVAVDEAHCAARRGHDWRPAYRALGARLRDWASTDGRAPALAALSGGASPGALAEAERALGLASPERVRAGAPRTNLGFRVWRSAAPDHLPRLRELLTRVIPEGRFGPGIVFCPRVDGPLGAADVAEELAWSENVDAAAFTGRPPRGADAARWAERKRRAADAFLAGRRGLLCATRAFGLGVDRADVRFTVHLGLPASLEEFYQQAGRAGRDGLAAACWLVLQVLSERRARRWAALPLETLRSELAALAPDQRDDAARAYWFHLGAFPGADVETRDVELALFALGDPAVSGPAEPSAPGQDAEALTRALLRLEAVGAVELRERRAAGWRVRRTGGWTAASALAAAADKIAFDYRAVEPARRASLAELVELALAPDADAALAQRLSLSVPVSRRYSAAYASSAGPHEESLAMAVARATGRASGWR